MLPPDLVERDVFKVKDIEGTAPKKQYQRGTAHDTQNYHDVTRGAWKSTRSVNPLEPTYTIRDSGEGFRAAAGSANSNYGTINGSRPTGGRAGRTAPKSLHTLDILGAQSSTRTIGGVKAGYVRGCQKNPNDISDI